MNELIILKTEGACLFEIYVCDFDTVNFHESCGSTFFLKDEFVVAKLSKETDYKIIYPKDKAL